MNRRAAAKALIAAMLIGTWGAASARAQLQVPEQATPGRQITMFAIHATPMPGGNKTVVDEKLKKIEPQLRKLFGDQPYSFKLLATESKRLVVGQVITCRPGSGFIAGTELMSALDEEGNIKLRFALELNGQTEFSTIVRTPPNQLFFCDKQLPDGSKLLIGLGGR